MLSTCDRSTKVVCKYQRATSAALPNPQHYLPKKNISYNGNTLKTYFRTQFQTHTATMSINAE